LPWQATMIGGLLGRWALPPTQERNTPRAKPNFSNPTKFLSCSGCRGFKSSVVLTCKSHGTKTKPGASKCLKFGHEKWQESVAQVGYIRINNGDFRPLGIYCSSCCIGNPHLSLIPSLLPSLFFSSFLLFFPPFSSFFLKKKFR